MNGLLLAKAELAALTAGLRERAASGSLSNSGGVDVALCPPATLLASFAAELEDSVALGGQDCHPSPSGAHTGDISAEMLADAGASYVIVGHSERRADHGESDARIRAKADAARRAGLVAIICVGETEAERDAGRTLDIVSRQLMDSIPSDATPERVVVAYEPVWAIGTGRTPTPQDIELVQTAIRNDLAARFGEGADQFRLLYGGSMKPSNAAEILQIPNVDGGLIGGASLKAADLLAIIDAAIALKA